MLLVSLVAFNLSQHVKIPTHNRGHTLVVIITLTEDRPFQPTNTIAGPYIFDHRLIMLETIKTKPKTKIKGQKIRNINENTIHKFCENFNNDPIMEVTALEEAVNHLNQEMLRTLNLVTPTKEVKIKKRRPTPWYDEELKQKRKILKNRKCKWFRYMEDHHWLAYKHKRNRYINILKVKKTHSLHQLVNQNSTDTEKLFKQVNELTKTRTKILYQRPSLTKT